LYVIDMVIWCVNDIPPYVIDMPKPYLCHWVCHWVQVVVIIVATLLH
jgi:hypothetical protein